jgi:hypothetical protein
MYWAIVFFVLTTAAVRSESLDLLVNESRQYTRDDRVVNETRAGTQADEAATDRATLGADRGVRSERSPTMPSRAAVFRLTAASINSLSEVLLFCGFLSYHNPILKRRQRMKNRW